MDQNTLALEASVVRGTLIDFEKGKRTPGANNVDAIARGLLAAGVESPLMATGPVCGLNAWPALHPPPFHSRT